MVWCGARNGRVRQSPLRGASKPATLQIVEISIASSVVRGGKIPGSRRASIVFPPPGGPRRITLWFPAAAISSARLAWAWPRTSAKSASSAVVASGTSTGFSVSLAASPLRSATAWRSVEAASTSRPETAAASARFATGTSRVPTRSRRQVSAAASTPRTGWIWPSSASSPTTASGAVRTLTIPVAVRMPRAIGRSNAEPSLRRSAGARFTVTRSFGKA